MKTSDVYDAINFLEEGELALFESLVGQSLCPVGVGGRFLHFIAPSEETFLLHDEWFEYLHAKIVHDYFELVCDPEFKDREEIILRDDQKPPAFRDAE